MSNNENNPEETMKNNDEIITEKLLNKNASNESMRNEEGEELSIEQMEEQIYRQCVERGDLYADPEFNSSNAFGQNEENGEEGKEGGFNFSSMSIDWKYPTAQEGYEFVCNGYDMSDVEQGALGDCWFIASVAITASKPEMLDQLFVNTDYFEFGFITCQFFTNGAWQQVIIDTSLPWDAEREGWCFARSRNRKEVWVALLEKAYAKLKGGYHKLHGGQMKESLVDLSGGLVNTVSLEGKGDKENFKYIQSLFKKGYLMGCVIKQKDKRGKLARDEEMITDLGLVVNHAYSVMDIVEVMGYRLIQLRNPWGQGEWTGPFSDNDPSLTEDLKRQLEYESLNDGVFYMLWSDFFKNFGKVYVCKVFGESLDCQIIADQWEGKKNGGVPPTKRDGEETYKDASMVTYHYDNDDKWFLNPQYRMEVAENQRFWFSLAQADAKSSGLSYADIDFSIFKVKKSQLRIWVYDEEKVPKDIEYLKKEAFSREITKSVLLEKGDYIIIPHCAKIKDKKYKHFWLRVFGRAFAISQCPEPFETSRKAVWNTKTHGDRRFKKEEKKTEGGKNSTPIYTENNRWFMNPQFYLNLTELTHFKLVLTKGKENRSLPKQAKLGFTLCKPPMKENESNIENLPKIQQIQERKKKMRLDLKPELDEFLERKMYISAVEQDKLIDCGYLSDKVAVGYFNYHYRDGPFLIITTLSDADRLRNDQEFDLTVYSDKKVELRKLDDIKSQILFGEFDKQTSGGSYIYSREFLKDKESWSKNPKFSLKIFPREGDQVIKFKVCISRSEKQWKEIIERNKVGSMLGLYVFERKKEVEDPLELCDKNVMLIDADGRDMPVFKGDEIYSRTFELNLEELSEEGYILMPSTFEKKYQKNKKTVSIEGSFQITIYCDNNFEFQNFN